MTNPASGGIRVALAIILSLAGLALSAHLLQEHVKLATGSDASIIGPECRTSGQISCDEVLKSDWGYFPFGSNRVGWRIPTAMLGFFYFAATTAWFFIVGRPSGARAGWHLLAVLMTLGGACFAGYLDYVMWMKLPTIGELRAFGGTQPDASLAPLRPICVYCLATHIISGLLLLVTLLLWPRHRPTTIIAEQTGADARGSIRVDVPAPDFPSTRALIAFVLMAVSIGATGASTYRYQLAKFQGESDLSSRDSLIASFRGVLKETNQDTEQAKITAAACRAQVEALTARLAEAATQPSGDVAATKRELEEAQARLKDYDEDYQAVYFNFAHESPLALPVQANDSIRGRPDARHTIVMFTDLQCEYCRRADEIVREKLAKYPDQLRLVVKHYPLNKTCNQYAKGAAHAAACAAAVTVEAVRAVGGDEAFWRMYDELFAHQGEFAKGAQAFLKEASARIGVDNDAIWKKISTTGVWMRIKEQVEQAHAAGIDATPAVYFDGRKVAAWANGKFWDYLMFLDKQGSLPAAPASAPAPAASNEAAPAASSVTTPAASTAPSPTGTPTPAAQPPGNSESH